MQPFAMIKHWILAARPKTLGAALIPVAVGSGLAAGKGTFQAVPALLCALFAILIQIGTNYANDYYDFIQGADTDNRIGPNRAVARGWITPPTMKTAFFAVFGAAFLIGLGLVPYGGWALVGIGILSILSGVAYTGGPYPLGYRGWGDVFVFLFFGFVATIFTYFVQSSQFSFEAWAAACLPGALATCLLVVNNHRDAPEDRKAGKLTLAARFGRRFAEREYDLMLGISAVSLLILSLLTTGLLVLLPLMLAPVALRARSRLRDAISREDYDGVLALTALLLLAGGLLPSIVLAASCE